MARFDPMKKIGQMESFDQAERLDQTERHVRVEMRLWSPVLYYVRLAMVVYWGDWAFCSFLRPIDLLCEFPTASAVNASRKKIQICAPSMLTTLFYDPLMPKVLTFGLLMLSCVKYVAGDCEVLTNSLCLMSRVQWWWSPV
jgi:hypothetical protein